MEDQDLVAICSVQNLMEAEIIRGALQSGGFACKIGGETQGGFAGVLEIDVLTHADVAEEAIKYLHGLKRFSKHLRKQAREEKEARRAASSSEAIQELPSKTEIRKPAE